MLLRPLRPQYGTPLVACAQKHPWRSDALAFLAIALATLVGFYWVTIPDPRNLSLLFLGVVLVAGLWGGLRPALVAALLACLSYKVLLMGLSVSRGLIEAFGGQIRSGATRTRGADTRIEVRLQAHPALATVE